MLQILANVTCGGGAITIDEVIPSVTTTVVTIIKIGIPVLLIIFGIMDLGKAVMSNDEKEMKGAQSKFLKRCLYAVLVFFVVAIVQFIVGILAKRGDAADNKNIVNCIDCFITDFESCKRTGGY